MGAVRLILSHLYNTLAVWNVHLSLAMQFTRRLLVYMATLSVVAYVLIIDYIPGLHPPLDDVSTDPSSFE